MTQPHGKYFKRPLPITAELKRLILAQLQDLARITPEELSQTELRRSVTTSVDLDQSPHAF